jgi:hypothetical protein
LVTRLSPPLIGSVSGGWGLEAGDDVATAGKDALLVWGIVLELQAAANKIKGSIK